MTSIVTRGIKATSLFKLLFLGYFFSFFPLLLLLWLLNTINVPYTIFNWNETEIVGVRGLLHLLWGVPIFVIIFSSVNWLFLTLGQWIWTRFRPLAFCYRASSADKEDIDY